MADTLGLIEQIGGHVGTAGGLIAWTVTRFQALVKKIEDSYERTHKIATDLGELAKGFEVFRDATRAAIRVLEQKQNDAGAAAESWKTRTMDSPDALRPMGASRRSVLELKDKIALLERQLTEIREKHDDFALDEEFERFVRETDRKWTQLERALDRLEALMGRNSKF